MTGSTLKLLFIGDVFGKPGMDILARLLPGLIRRYKTDMVVANGENCDEGRGLTIDQVRFLINLGVTIITSGNHIWDKTPLRKAMRNLPNLLRPLNYPAGSGGHGSIIHTTDSGIRVAVINLQGRTYMRSIDCPFRTIEREIKRIEGNTDIILVDVHAESTAEKIALGWHLDGLVSAVVGTHTHVQTADERILPRGTGFITDVGMTGSADSVIGMSIKAAIQRFITQTPQPFHLSLDNLRLNGVLLDFNAETGRCNSIERINIP